MWRPSPAMVLALIALVVAASGAAMAAPGMIGGGDVQDESLTGADIDNGTLKGADLAAGAVQSSDVRDGSLRVTDLRPGAVAALSTPDVVVRTEDGTGLVIASCNPGEQLIGGGVLSRQTATPISVNTPEPSNGGVPRMWLGQAADRGGISVQVICAK